MAHIAIQQENKSSVLRVSSNTSAVEQLKIKAADTFNTPALFVLRASPTVATKNEKKLSYLATKRNLLVVTIVYTVILASVLFVLL